MVLSNFKYTQVYRCILINETIYKVSVSLKYYPEPYIKGDGDRFKLVHKKLTEAAGHWTPIL